MNGSLLIAVVLSLLSAAAYALSAVAQERLAAASSTSAGPISTLTSPRWWLSFGLNGGGGLLHAVALAYGSLAVVQPLGMLTLVVALPLGAVLAGRRVTGREWRGATTTVVGLVGLLLAVDTGAPSEALGNPQILILSGFTAVAIAILVLNRGPQPAVETGEPPVRAARFHGLRLAAASGIAFAVSSVLTQTVLLRGIETPDAVLHDPMLAVALLIVLGLTVGAMVLSQAAYRYGLGAQLATLSIVNPVVSAGLGIALLDQGVGLTLSAVCIGIAGAALAVFGVALLAKPEPVQPGPTRVRTALQPDRVLANPLIRSADEERCSEPRR